MLKFIKHHLDTILGIEIYPMLSFVIFLTFFVFVALWAFKADKRHFDKQSNLPLEQ